MRAAVNDWRSAPLTPRMHAMLAFLEKLTLTPDAVSATDIKPLRDVGLSDAAIEDAIHVCVLFNVYDRLADSFKFALQDEAGLAMGARMLLGRGYA